MNKQSWIGALLVLVGFVLLQWMDNTTEARIAEADAAAAQAILASIAAHEIDCGAPVTVAERQQ